ncbi:MAG TPA: hypothetical protein VI316_12175 [Candidatus Dormibacteraeota bacterium]
MIGVHQRIGASIVALGAVGVVWAIVLLLRRTASPRFRMYVRLLAVLIAVQGALGILLVITGHRPVEGLHFVYGPVLLIALPVALRLGAPAELRRETRTLLWGCVAVVLLAIRAVSTGG